MYKAKNNPGLIIKGFISIYGLWINPVTGEKLNDKQFNTFLNNIKK